MKFKIFYLDLLYPKYIIIFLILLNIYLIYILKYNNNQKFNYSK